MASNTSIATTVMFLILMLGLFAHFQLWVFAIPCATICIALPLLHLADILVKILHALEGRR